MAKATVLAVLTNIPKTFIKNSSSQCQFTDYFGTVHLLDTGVSGVGGIDTGVVTLSTFYYVYKVATGIIASISSSEPTGYTYGYQKIGAFYTDTTGLIFKVYKLGEVNKLSYGAEINASGVIVEEASNDFALTISSGTTKLITFITGIFSLAPIVSATPVTISFRTSNVGAVTALSAEYSIWRTDSNTIELRAAHVIVIKNGVDAIQPIW